MLLLAFKSSVFWSFIATHCPEAIDRDHCYKNFSRKKNNFFVNYFFKRNF